MAGLSSPRFILISSLTGLSSNNSPKSRLSETVIKLDNSVTSRLAVKGRWSYSYNLLVILITKETRRGVYSEVNLDLNTSTGWRGQHTVGRISQSSKTSVIVAQVHIPQSLSS